LQAFLKNTNMKPRLSGAFSFLPQRHKEHKKEEEEKELATENTDNTEKKSLEEGRAFTRINAN